MNFMPTATKCLEYVWVRSIARSVINLPDIVHVEPLFLEEVHAVFAFFHTAIVRITVPMEQALHLVAVHAGPALVAFVVRILSAVTESTNRGVHHARIYPPF